MKSKLLCKSCNRVQSKDSKWKLSRIEKKIRLGHQSKNYKVAICLQFSFELLFTRFLLSLIGKNHFMMKKSFKFIFWFLCMKWKYERILPFFYLAFEPTICVLKIKGKLVIFLLRGNFEIAIYASMMHILAHN